MSDGYTCAVCLLTRELVSDQYPAVALWQGTGYCETHLQEAAEGDQSDGSEGA